MASCRVLFGLAHFHAAVLRLPGVDGVLAYALLPGHIFRRAARFNLLQRSNDLRLRVLASAHPSFPFLRPNRSPKWTDLGGP